MSNLPLADADMNYYVYEDSDPLILNPFGQFMDDPWLMRQETSSESPMISNHHAEMAPAAAHRRKMINSGNHVNINVDQQPNLASKQGIDVSNCSAGIIRSNKTKENQTISCRHKDDDVELEKSEEEEEEDGPSSVSTKKMDHNARERVRRMKLNASYLALRALLPDSRRTKKRWSAPLIVDKALKYIPELEKEIQRLKLAKKHHGHDQPLAAEKSYNEHDAGKVPNYITLSISVDEMMETEEAILIQICMPEDLYANGSAFTNLLMKVEAEGHFIASASTLRVCDARSICLHVHVQIDRDFIGDEDGVQELKSKLRSWLS